MIFGAKSCCQNTAKTFVFTYFVTPDKSKEGFEKIVDELRLGMVNAITCDNFHLKNMDCWKNGNIPMKPI